MENPFLPLDRRLDSIESILADLKNMLAQPPAEHRHYPIGIDRVCELTHLSRATVYGLTSAKKIPHTKRGKKLLFDEDEVLDWLRQGKRMTLAEIDAEADAHLERLRARKS